MNEGIEDRFLRLLYYHVVKEGRGEVQCPMCDFCGVGLEREIHPSDGKLHIDSNGKVL